MKKRGQNRGKARGGVTVLGHPLVAADLTMLRDKRTGPAEFRAALERVSHHLGVAALSGIPTSPRPVVTPLTKAKGQEVSGRVILAPVLRAGLGLLKGFLDVYPHCSVGHIGVYRDERTLAPVHYYVRLPKDLRGSYTVILDPMLATGGSAVAAIEMMRKRNARTIVLATLLAAPEGIRRVRKEHPGVRIITCAIDSRLNSRGFIVPGLGDAGDRMFGTESW